uniref:Myosin motor domain-containing protein n=1 Tax=Callorhinchus milii TaxID=7868 RepID=A0A4W3HAE6_CALMI
PLAVDHWGEQSQQIPSSRQQDMVLLDPLTEDSLLSNLKKRFNKNEIYTYIGNVVVSINPYQSLPIYTPEMIAEYRKCNLYELRPHM